MQNRRDSIIECFFGKRKIFFDSKNSIRYSNRQSSQTLNIEGSDIKSINLSTKYEELSHGESSLASKLFWLLRSARISNEYVRKCHRQVRLCKWIFFSLSSQRDWAQAMWLLWNAESMEWKKMKEREARSHDGWIKLSQLSDCFELWTFTETFNLLFGSSPLPQAMKNGRALEQVIQFNKPKDGCKIVAGTFSPCKRFLLLISWIFSLQDVMCWTILVFRVI